MSFRRQCISIEHLKLNARQLSNCSYRPGRTSHTIDHCGEVAKRSWVILKLQTQLVMPLLLWHHTGGLSLR